MSNVSDVSNVSSRFPRFFAEDDSKIDSLIGSAARRSEALEVTLEDIRHRDANWGPGGKPLARPVKTAIQLEHENHVPTSTGTQPYTVATRGGVSYVVGDRPWYGPPISSDEADNAPHPATEKIRRTPNHNIDEDYVYESDTSSYQSLDDYTIVCSRNQPRFRWGEIAIECLECVDGDQKTFHQPLSFFIDDGYFIDETVSTWVNDWCNKAKMYPNHRRKCIMCRTKAAKGSVLCHRDMKKWHSTIYA